MEWREGEEERGVKEGKKRNDQMGCGRKLQVKHNP